MLVMVKYMRIYIMDTMVMIMGCLEVTPLDRTPECSHPGENTTTRQP